jgi:hypothetical protein
MQNFCMNGRHNEMRRRVSSIAKHLHAKVAWLPLTWQAPKLPDNQVITWQVRALVYTT